MSENVSIDRDSIFWHYPHYNQHPESFPGGVIRSGDWKLIEAYDPDRFMLFNLRSDPGESQNVIDGHQEIASTLKKRLNQWRRDVGADMMLPNPEFRHQ